MNLFSAWRRETCKGFFSPPLLVSFVAACKPPPPDSSCFSTQSPNSKHRFEEISFCKVSTCVSSWAAHSDSTSVPKTFPPQALHNTTPTPEPHLSRLTLSWELPPKPAASKPPLPRKSAVFSWKPNSAAVTKNGCSGTHPRN